MNNTYTIKEKDLKKALDQVDNFREKIIKFSNKYPGYSYNVIIKHINDLKEWIIELNINNNEKTKTQAS